MDMPDAGPPPIPLLGTIRGLAAAHPFGPEEPRPDRPAPGYTSIAHASRRLGVDQRDVRRMLGVGELTGVYVRGRPVWIASSDVAAMASKTGAPGNPPHPGAPRNALPERTVHGGADA